MSDDKKHIGKYLNEPLPDPEVPAENAWAQMNGMLPPPPAPAGPGKFWGSFAKLKVLLTVSAVVITTSAAVVWNIMQNEKTANVTYQKIEPAAKPELPDAYLKQYETDSPGDESKSEQKSGNFALPYSPADNPDTLHAKRIFNKPETESRQTIVKPSPELTHGRNVSKTVNRKNFNAHQQAFTVSKERKVAPNQINTETLKKPLTSNERVRFTASDISNTFQKNTFAAIQNLNQRPMRFAILKPTNILYQPRKSPEKIKKGARNFWSGFHFGPEWSMNFSFADNTHLLTGTDSINRPTQLLIPGLFIGKTWNAHSLIFTFTPYNSYYGNSKLIAQQRDSIPMSDSTFIIFRYNKNLIKTMGLNFMLQYQYAVTNWISLNAGVSYNLLGSALLREETENYRGEILPGKAVQIKRSGNLNTYLHPNLFAIRAGIVLQPIRNRIQVGTNVIVPVSAIGQDPKINPKSLNGQVYLRVFIR